MDNLEFISQLIKSLAWPVAILVIIVLFRNHIGKLISSIEKIRYKDVDIEFVKKTSLVAEEVSEQIKLDKELVEKYPAEIKNNFDRFKRIAEIDPRGAVINAWIFLEDILREFAVKKGVYDEKYFATPIWLINDLAESKVLSEHVAEKILDLWSLRCKAVHDIDFYIPTKSAKEYVSTSEKLALYLLTQ